MYHLDETVPETCHTIQCDRITFSLKRNKNVLIEKNNISPQSNLLPALSSNEVLIFRIRQHFVMILNMNDVKKGVISPSESFSPESGGRVKPRTAMEAMSTQGTIRLKK